MDSGDTPSISLRNSNQGSSDIGPANTLTLARVEQMARSGGSGLTAEVLNSSLPDTDGSSKKVYQKLYELNLLGSIDINELFTAGYDARPQETRDQLRFDDMMGDRPEYARQLTSDQLSTFVHKDGPIGSSLMLNFMSDAALNMLTRAQVQGLDLNKQATFTTVFWRKDVMTVREFLQSKGLAKLLQPGSPDETAAIPAGVPIDPRDLESGSSVLLNGWIDDDIVDPIIAKLKAQMLPGFQGTKITEIAIISNGGHMDKALELGRAIRAAGVNTRVPDAAYAESAGAAIFCAGVQRTVGSGGYLAFHTWRDKVTGQQGNLLPGNDPGNVQMADYFREMGYGRDIGEEGESGNADGIADDMFRWSEASIMLLMRALASAVINKECNDVLELAPSVSVSTSN